MSPIPVGGIDQEEAWAPSGAILGPGKHNVLIAEAEETKSTNGYPQIHLQLEASDGLGIQDWMVVIPSSYGKVLQLLEAASVPVPSGADAQLDASILRGRKVLITVAEETNPAGKQVTRVKAYERPGGGIAPQSQQVRDEVPF